MTFTVVIPFRPTLDSARQTALGYVTGWLHSHHDWPLVMELDEDPGSWSKGTVVDAGVRRAKTEGLILHDADVLIDPGELERATLAVTAGVPWVMPHRTVYRLSRRGSMRAMRGILGERIGPVDPIHCERTHPAPDGGGIVVLSRRAYDAVGGLDRRFTDWGGEDISFARALDTIAGVGLRGDAPLWHLWHRPQYRRRGNRASAANERLASAYLDAVGDPLAMRRIRR